MSHSSKNVDMGDWSHFGDEECLPESIQSLLAAFANAGACMMKNKDSNVPPHVPENPVGRNTASGAKHNKVKSD
jgi:hypothetical protein